MNIDFVLSVLNHIVLSIYGIFSKNVTTKKRIILCKQFNGLIYNLVESQFIFSLIEYFVFFHIF